jgi:hypothetical protein
MGGPGPGHKSEKARRSQLANIAKAIAARKRPLLPWRSGRESKLIEQLVWQWWISTPPNAKPLSSIQRQACSPRAKRRWRSPQPKAPVGPDRPWPIFHVARLLGVSHTWIYTLIRRFEADPDRFRRRMAPFAPATFDKLLQAREETRRERVLGRLRPPIRYLHIDRDSGKKAETCRTHQGGNAPHPGKACRSLAPAHPRHLRRPALLGQRPRPCLVPASPLAAAPRVRTVMMPPVPPPSSTPRPVPFAFRRRRH